MKDLHFYRLLLSSFWRTSAFIVYCILLIASVFLLDASLRLSNLFTITLMLAIRLNDLRKLPHGQLMPGYRQSQTLIAYGLIFILGLFPLLLGATSYENLLMLMSSGLLIISVILFQFYLVSLGSFLALLAMGIIWIPILMATLMFMPMLNPTPPDIHNLPFYEWKLALAFVLFTAIFFLNRRHHDIEPKLANAWKVDHNLHALLSVGIEFNLHSLPMPKNPKSLYALFFFSFNPFLILTIAIAAIVVLDEGFDIGHITQSAPLFGLFMIPMIASVQVVSRFSNMNQLWLASHYKTKSEFLFRISILRSINWFLPFIICMSYFFLKYDSISIIILPLFVFGCSAIFLMISLTLTGRSLFVAVMVAATLSFILSNHVGLMLSILTCGLTWILSIYYYSKHEGEHKGMIVPPIQG